MSKHFIYTALICQNVMFNTNGAQIVFTRFDRLIHNICSNLNFNPKLDHWWVSPYLTLNTLTFFCQTELCLDNFVVEKWRKLIQCLA